MGQGALQLSGGLSEFRTQIHVSTTGSLPGVNLLPIMHHAIMFDAGICQRVASNSRYFLLVKPFLSKLGKAHCPEGII
jgi:hypothetical protein